MRRFNASSCGWAASSCRRSGPVSPGSLSRGVRTTSTTSGSTCTWDRNLAKVGVKAVPQDLLNTDEVDLSDFPRMYWGRGAQILRTARFVATTPDAYGIHVENFSCGADSFVEHFYRHVMKPSPYLILELDEHSAVAGMVTRLEAFAHVIRNEQGREHHLPDAD